MSQPKENRFVIQHNQRGLYLGNGWWSNGPEASQVNCAPTFTVHEVNNHPAINQNAVGPTGAWARLVGHEVIDMAGDRISVASAVRNGLVNESWCAMATATEG